MQTSSMACIARNTRGYVYVEYLVLLVTVGLVAAAAGMALLPILYQGHLDNMSVLLSIDP
jgi:hypothetical protein